MKQILLSLKLFYLDIQSLNMLAKLLCYDSKVDS